MLLLQGMPLPRLAGDYLGHGVGASALGDLLPQAAVQ